jgi:hypothetical protein
VEAAKVSNKGRKRFSGIFLIPYAATQDVNVLMAVVHIYRYMVNHYHAYLLVFRLQHLSHPITCGLLKVLADFEAQQKALKSLALNGWLHVSNTLLNQCFDYFNLCICHYLGVCTIDKCLQCIKALFQAARVIVSEVLFPIATVLMEALIIRLCILEHGCDLFVCLRPRLPVLADYSDLKGAGGI